MLRLLHSERDPHTLSLHIKNMSRPMSETQVWNCRIQGWQHLQCQASTANTVDGSMQNLQDKDLAHDIMLMNASAQTLAAIS
jgi:hypothetical protein